MQKKYNTDKEHVIIRPMGMLINVQISNVIIAILLNAEYSQSAAFL